MRVTFHYQCKNYPLSRELTERSKRVGILTHPLYGIVLGGMLGTIACYIFPDSVNVPMCIMLAGVIGGPILLHSYRKKKFAQFDAEYAQLLQSMQK